MSEAESTKISDQIAHYFSALARNAEREERGQKPTLVKPRYFNVRGGASVAITGKNFPGTSKPLSRMGIRTIHDFSGVSLQKLTAEIPFDSVLAMAKILETQYPEVTLQIGR